MATGADSGDFTPTQAHHLPHVSKLLVGRAWQVLPLLRNISEGDVVTGEPEEKDPDMAV